MKENRFKGKAGEEYELFKLACPHFDELEGQITNLIKNKYNDSSLKKIEVLELGSGPGYTTFLILDADDRIVVTSVDNEEVMIKQSEKNLHEQINNGRVKLVLDDGLAFLKKQSDNSFEVFASGFTLHNFDNDYRDKVLHEIYRVLKKGGLFVNADKYALDDEKEHKENLNWQLDKFNKVYSKINRLDLIREWTEHYKVDDGPRLIMKEGVAIAQMSKIGFVNIKKVYRKKMEALVTAEK